MDTLAIDIAVAAAGLAAGSGLTVLFVRRRRDAPLDPDNRSGSLPDMEPLIEDAARRWARVRGRPEIAPLVADKLRTLHRIKYGYSRPARRRRWTRW